LEEQALHPVRDDLEMALGWEEAVQRLQEHPSYPGLFRKAFGIKNIKEIDSILVAKALAQFQRTLISSNAKLDRVKRGEATFTAAEERGSHIFSDSSPNDTPVSECVHCHVDPLFTNLEFFNNGILTPEEQKQIQDKGRFAITGRDSDRHKFRTPTLRNIARTAPYMHDGRFATLEEVIDHYASGGHFAENVNPNVRVLHLESKDKADLIAFLHTLTDSTAIFNSAYHNPNLVE
jgi:cytochrome c peroxidase